MRLPRLQATLAIGHWDRLELTGTDGKTLLLERGREWSLERADRILGLVGGPRELIEIDTAQTVGIRIHENRPPKADRPIDPDRETRQTDASAGGSYGDSR